MKVPRKQNDSTVSTGVFQAAVSDNIMYYVGWLILIKVRLVKSLGETFRHFLTL